MKKILLPLLVLAISLTGCLELTQEITINADGSGTVSNTNDGSPLFKLAKAMGSAEDLKKIENLDTTTSLKNVVDKDENLTAQEKDLLRKGSLSITINRESDIIKTRVQIPFSSPDQLNFVTGLAERYVEKNAMNGMKGVEGMEGIGEYSSMDQYYEISFKKGKIKKKVIKDKYAKLADDKYLASFKEAMEMGIEPLIGTYIINLPSPAKKVEGRFMTVSPDKKKITIEISINEFFEDPSNLEFEIEY